MGWHIVTMQIVSIFISSIFSTEVRFSFGFRLERVNFIVEIGKELVLWPLIPFAHKTNTCAEKIKELLTRALQTAQFLLLVPLVCFLSVFSL